MSKPIQAPGAFFNNLVAQAKAYIPGSFDLKNPALVSKIETHAFDVLIAIGAAACLRSNKTAFAVGAALSVAVQLKYADMMKLATEVAPKYLTLGENELGLLSLFVPSKDAKLDARYKAAANSMLALMIVTLVSSWLGSKIIAASIGFLAVQQLYQLSQKKPPISKEISEESSLKDQVARKLNFELIGKPQDSSPFDPQGMENE